MNLNVFDPLTRRASFMSLAAAGLTAALGSPFFADAKKKRGKNKGKKVDATKLCKKQVGQCLDVFIPLCGGDPACQAAFEKCCPTLGNCDFNGFTVCLNSVG